MAANVQFVRDALQGGEFGVDKNGVPCGWRWKINRTIFFDDGSSTDVTVWSSFSSEDLSAHISQALVAQAADIAADAAERDALRSELETVTAERDALRAAQAQPSELPPP